MKITWDSRKAVDNIKKHGVSFEEALSVFRDRTALIFDDDDHSEFEHREIIIGHSVQNRLILVVFTERNEIIRIISARRVNQREGDKYEKEKR